MEPITTILNYNSISQDKLGQHLSNIFGYWTPLYCSELLKTQENFVNMGYIYQKLPYLIPCGAAKKNNCHI